MSSRLLEYLRVPTSGKTSSSRFINDDIRPLPPSRRTWTTWVYISFWAINQICLSNWQLGASLVAFGLSVWQAIISIIIGKFIIAAVAIFNGWVGAEYHIGYVVVSRYIWGIYGSYFALVQRIILSLVWFAVSIFSKFVPERRALNLPYRCNRGQVVSVFKTSWLPSSPHTST